MKKFKLFYHPQDPERPWVLEFDETQHLLKSVEVYPDIGTWTRVEAGSHPEAWVEGRAEKIIIDSKSEYAIIRD